MSKIYENLVNFYYNKLNEAPSKLGMLGKGLGGLATAVGLGELIDALQAGMSPEDVKYNQAGGGGRSGSGGGFNVSADAASSLVSGDRAKYNEYVANLYNSGMSQNQITGSAIRTRAMAANTAKEQAANIRATTLKDDPAVKEARKALEDARAARDIPGQQPDPAKVAAAQDAAKKLKEAERAALEKTSYYDVARRRNALQSGGFNAPTQEKPEPREPFKYVNPNSAEARLIKAGVLTPEGKINPEYGEKDEFGFLNTPAGRAAALRAAKEDTRKTEKEMRDLAASNPDEFNKKYPASSAAMRAQEMKDKIRNSLNPINSLLK